MNLASALAAPSVQPFYLLAEMLVRTFVEKKQNKKLNSYIHMKKLLLLFAAMCCMMVVEAEGNNPSTTLIENTGDDLAESLAGKRFAGGSDLFNIIANQDPDHKTHYYSSFYSFKKAYSVPEGVTAYTGAVDGSVLKLTAIESGIIPAGEAVILRLTTENNTAPKKQFDLTVMTTMATKSTDNMLVGNEAPTKPLRENEYALSLGQYGVGFYLWEGKEIDAHKAYLIWDGSKTGAKAFTFQFEDETDGIQNCQLSTVNSQLSTYNLTGVRVNNGYKGIVIVNGKKYVVK